MEVYCTRPDCPRPVNHFADLDNSATLKTVQQKYCTTCGMPLILLGRYVPLKLLGKGGFGAAFLARDRYTPAMRQCVVKQFQPSGDLTPSQLQIAQGLFEREGAVLEELGNSHPQIPDLLAFFELQAVGKFPSQTDRFFYLVQEFIDGQNLEEELAQKGTFSETEIREVLTEILKVLKYVHSHDSIHRDIKPSNIMRRRDGRLYLLDFGAVKQVTSGVATPGGKASTGIYSMGFAPPEQMAGNVVYPATDLYALGVTCITLLTGKQPSELYDAYSNGWNWRGFAPVSDRLEATLNRMLLATPSQRFQSADEVLDALNAPLPSASAPPPPAPSASSPSASPSAGATQSSQSAPRQKKGASRKGSAPPQSATPPTPMAAAQPAGASSPPVKAAPAPPPTKPAFSLVEWIGGAAFTGFEGGLLAIALVSALGTSLVSAGFWVILVGVLVFSQSRRIIEKVDLLIIATITLAVLLIFPTLRDFWLLATLGNVIPALIILAVLAALGTVAVMLLFRLVYKILSSLL